ncbi:MAG: O-antigen ligase family protein [bacterium]|nr:O-antigen ligase family protein [bacterium]
MHYRDSFITALRRIILGGLFFTPFFILVVAPALPYPFVTGRHFLFRILVEILLVLWLVLIALDEEYKPRVTRTTKFLLLFLGIVIVADFLGVDPYRSFWSNYRRMEGMIGLLHFGAYFLLLQNFFRREREWLIFFRCVVLAGCIVSVMTLLQHLGIFPRLGNDTRMTATIGNTSLLSGYLLLHAFIALLLCFRTKRILIRLLYGICIALAFVAIFFASTRAVLLALYVVAFFFFISVLWHVWKTPRFQIFRIFSSVAIFLFIATPFFFLAMRMTPVVQGNYSLAHFTQVDATLGARTTLWKIAWKAFLQRPLLGWGQENYLIAYGQHHDPSLFQFEERWFDRPHNIFVDWLVSAGLLGLLAYCGLLYAAYRGLRETVRRGMRPWQEGMVLGAALFAYVLQNLFVFDSFGTYLLFFALYAYSDVPLMPQASPSSSAPRQAFAHTILYGAFATSFIFVFIVTASASFIYPILSGEAFVAGVSLWQQKRPLPLVQAFFERALAVQTFGTEEIRMSLIAPVAAETIKGNIYAPAAIASFLRFAFHEGEKEAWRQPPNLRAFTVLSSVYRIAGRGDSAYLGRAAMILAEARRLFSQNPYIIFEEAWTHLYREERALAVTTAEEGVALDPTITKSILQLALVAIHAGDQAREQQALQQLFREEEPSVSMLVTLAEAYVAVGRFRDAIPLYRTIVVREQGNSSYYENLLQNEWKQGDKEKARRLGQMLVKRQPTYQKKLQFLFEDERAIVK